MVEVVQSASSAFHHRILWIKVKQKRFIFIPLACNIKRFGLKCHQQLQKLKKEERKPGQRLIKRDNNEKKKKKKDVGKWQENILNNCDIGLQYKKIMNQKLWPFGRLNIREFLYISSVSP